MRLLRLRKAPSLRKALWCVVASAALGLAALATGSAPAGAAQVASTTSTASTVAASTASTVASSASAASSLRPCNIYAAGGTPCVAAYSTVRALYRGYRGPLYQVTR